MKKFLVPKPGIKVRDPENMQFLPAEGGEVTDSKYWQRRVADGDVVEGTPPKPKRGKE